MKLGMLVGWRAFHVWAKTLSRGIVAIAALGASCPLSWAQGQEASPAKIWTLCELFEDLLSHSGKIIRVRGQLIPYHEGWTLSPGERCPKQFTVGEMKWPTELALEDAGASRVAPPASFELDKPAMKRLTDLVRSLRRGGPFIDPTEDIRITVTGELRTGKIVTEMLGPIPYRLHYGPGFGPLLGPNGIRCPAQLVIKTVEDIVVSPK